MEACRVVDMTPPGVYQQRKREPAFRAAWTEALREGFQTLELAMLDRAVNGTEKPVFYAGKQIGTLRQFSDGAALRLLAHHRHIALAAVPGTLDAATVAEARATIERRVRAIRIKNARVAEMADGDRG